MSNTNSYKAFSLSLLLFAALFAAAQGTTVRATVDKNKLLIGEPVLLTLIADIPENEPIRFFYIDSIPHFEFLEKPAIDTTNTAEGTRLQQVIKITSFDSGHWVIPAFNLRDDIFTDTIPMDVVFSDFNPEQDYHDIKDIMEVTPEKEKDKRWIWFAIGGGVLLLIVVLYLVLRKKKPVVQAPVAAIDPYEEAMKGLEQLESAGADKKLFYSRMVDIFRVYISKRKGIHSLQKTTDDIVKQLKGLPITRDQFEKLSQSLMLSDFVKFAKYEPTREDDRKALDAIKQTIIEIEQLK